MTTPSIRKMLTKTGLHYISDTRFELHGQYFVVEVEPDGTCHQLTPDMRRDGVLRLEGWKQDAIEIENPELAAIESQPTEQK